ncbi:MAG: hypothetical protein ACYCW6_01575 [Candidatus Xenobia bacterium]
MFTYVEKTNPPPCPCCNRPLPNGAESAMAYAIRVRKGGVTFNCLKRICYCGLQFAVDRTNPERPGYSFRCGSCGQYQGEMPFSKRCTRCHLQEVVGLRDAETLYAGVREAEPYIPPSREDLLNGLLTGLLRGAPGLTVNDRAA